MEFRNFVVSDKTAQNQRQAVAAYKSHHSLINKEVWKK
jgi:hypothetical protein